MACEQARSLVSLRLDGEMSELQGAKLTAHLRGCQACRAYEADLDAIVRTIQTAPLEPLQMSVALPPSRLRRSLARWQVGTAAAAFAVVAFSSLFALSSGHGAFLYSLGLSGDRPSGGQGQAAARPAYLDSATYELRLIQEARAARERQRTGGPIAL